VRKTLCAAAVLFSLAASLASAADADEPAIRKAVLAVHNRMADAMRSLNTDKFFESIRDSGPGTIIDDGVLRLSRAEALDAVKRGLQGVASVDRKYNRVDVSVLAPTVALVTGEGIATFVLADGRSISSPFAVTELFVLTAGEWKLAHGHHSTPNPR
jgi:hypothetical protein